MTVDEIKTALDELENQRTELRTAIETAEADENPAEETVAELETRMKGIQDRYAELHKQLDEARAQEAEREETRKKIAEGNLGESYEKHEEETTMTEKEIRSTTEYIDAFARYIKTGDPRECRALLKTENASGYVPVPVMVDEIIRTAWDNEEILSRCRKTNFRGNVKVAFERSADGAYVHTEGTSAPTEEDLALGIVTMVPANIKKWVHVTDEDVTMGGEAFVRYIYEELAYQITKKLAALVVADITGLNTSNQTTSPGAARITAAPGLTTIAEAFANLSDEAANPVVIMNKLTYVNFMEAYAAGNFAVDPFMGLPVLYNNSLPAYDTATGGTDDYAIVGDLKGEQINFPEGDGVVIKWDDLSEAEADLVKVVGRQYAAHAVTAPFRFTRIKKPAAVTT